MRKQIFYIYNTNTDNYERYYPSLKKYIVKSLSYLIVGCVIATVILGIVYLQFGFHNDGYLVKENKTLKTKYAVLENRLTGALTILDNIRNRDDNFYRVMMQMDPMMLTQRYAGLDNESRYEEYKNLSDAKLITRLTQNMDLLDRQLYAQSLSFDELRKTALSQRDKLNHIPAVLPINISDYTMSSGYGYRRDPVFGTSAFHAGLDFAAPTGTPVYATADGKVSAATRAGGYGNKIDITHGYNYMTRYAHLSKIYVVEGQEIKRGDKIGEVGSTGKSTGPHLHYEVRFKDEPQNPVNYYFLDVTPQQYQAMIEAAENAGHVMD